MSSKPQPINKILVAHSERVKCVDMHPKEPLVLCALYSGQVTIWNFETQTLMKAFDVLENKEPVRCAKFIPRLQCFVCGGDDMMLRVYNYNTMERVKAWEAHQDLIRAIAVHETLPYVLSTSDDMTVRMWGWSKDWQCAMTFKDHRHYVMGIALNPKDQTTFATASLDETVIVWSLTSMTLNFTLEGHEAGVNCVEYFGGGDKPYLASGSDDRTVRVWDYQTKACLQVLQSHEKPISCLTFHPTLPLLFAGSEDETLTVYSTQTWRLDQTMSFGFERLWGLHGKRGTGQIAVGCDRGLVVLRVGAEEPVASMDANGKVIVAQNTEILRVNLKQAVDKEVADGELLQAPTKEIGSMESMPSKIMHGPNGQHIAVLYGDDEYTINSALEWRPAAFGKAIAFAWGAKSGTYAILENSATLKIFKQFKLRDTVKLPGTADALYAGPLLGVRLDGVLAFYDWERLVVVRRILETPRQVVWSDNDELLALQTDQAAFILKYNIQYVQEALARNAQLPPDGLEDAFDLVEELADKIRQLLWVGDCLIFCNDQERLNFYIGGEISSLAVLPRAFFLLGYVAKENRIYCIDRERNITSFLLYGSEVEYLTAIVRGDFSRASEIAPQLPNSVRYKIAKILQSRELPQIAIDLTTDDDHKFELAVTLRRLDVLQALIEKAPSPLKWKNLGDIALQLGEFDVARAALQRAGDFNGLLLLFSSVGDVNGLKALGKAAMDAARFNTAFTCYHMVGDASRCVDALLGAGMMPEAAFYARSYCHSRIMDCVAKWRHQVAGSAALRDAIADPVQYPDLFPGVVLPRSPAEIEVTPARGTITTAEPNTAAGVESTPVASTATAVAQTPEVAETPAPLRAPMNTPAGLRATPVAPVAETPAPLRAPANTPAPAATPAGVFAPNETPMPLRAPANTPAPVTPGPAAVLMTPAPLRAPQNTPAPAAATPGPSSDAGFLMSPGQPLQAPPPTPATVMRPTEASSPVAATPAPVTAAPAPPAAASPPAAEGDDDDDMWGDLETSPAKPAAAAPTMAAVPAPLDDDDDPFK